MTMTKSNPVVRNNPINTKPSRVYRLIIEWSRTCCTIIIITLTSRSLCRYWYMSGIMHTMIPNNTCESLGKNSSPPFSNKIDHELVSLIGIWQFFVNIQKKWRSRFDLSSLRFIQHMSPLVRIERFASSNDLLPIISKINQEWINKNARKYCQISKAD